MSLRLIVLRALNRVLEQGQSLSTVRPWVYRQLPDTRQRARAMQWVQAVLRWRWKLDAILRACMDKPLRNREREVRTLLWMALYEIDDMRSPDYAVVDETVKTVRKLRKLWAAALVNAVLRRYLREAESIRQQLDEQALASHPSWLLRQLQQDWPGHWHAVVEANNRPAPLCLRVNQRRIATRDYMQKLAQQGIEAQTHALADSAVVLAQYIDVTQLPGYDEGEFSVQDAGAQLAASLLDARPGQRVLDMCAAPGGKTCHLLERADNRLDLLALDNDTERLRRVEDNLARLRLKARTLLADAGCGDWYASLPGGAGFDRILLDVPCSATGVIRRHPDIKSLRQQQDIVALVAVQQAMLRHAWPLLVPGGKLLYATCSLLQAENSDVVKAFLQTQADAVEVMPEVLWGQSCDVGRQLLPGVENTDGFYYALLQKQ